MVLLHFFYESECSNFNIIFCLRAFRLWIGMIFIAKTVSLDKMFLADAVKDVDTKLLGGDQRDKILYLR